MIGQTLNEAYAIVGPLAKGGRGTLYEARHVETGRRVAIKVIDVAEANARAAARFAREIRLSGKIDSPHVVELIDAGVDERSERPFMVMEFLEGEDVEQVLSRVGCMSLDGALRIVAQSCLGLETAHRLGVLHRDIKPSNLFLTRAGDERVVKLIDFGVAKLLPNAAERPSDGTLLTRTGATVGTPRYMSPEQARGLKTIDQRADIWSLGVVLYRALAGKTPHHQATNFSDLICAIVTEAPPPIRKLAPWVPVDVANIIHRALELDPEARYQSAADFRADLLTLVGGQAALREADLVPAPQSS